MSSSTTRKYAAVLWGHFLVFSKGVFLLEGYLKESTGKRLSNINVETVKSNKLALPKLLFTSPSPGNSKYHFAHCGGEESRLSIGRGIVTSFHTLKDKYCELLTWTQKQPLPINVAASSAIVGVEGAFAGFLVHTMFQACLGSQAAVSP
ncbi:unnamed protein product [Arabis nemorensis]|uniref:Uncharacterized protein n=1 Tax=Arabis nemorensis TaxID=586526 RepID=A0A565B8Y5_9BRAS|nr:unnamed protein product [Arabis nemorensis]